MLTDGQLDYLHEQLRSQRYYKKSIQPKEMAEFINDQFSCPQPCTEHDAAKLILKLGGYPPMDEVNESVKQKQRLLKVHCQTLSTIIITIYRLCEDSTLFNGNELDIIDKSITSFEFTLSEINKELLKCTTKQN